MCVDSEEVNSCLSTKNQGQPEGQGQIEAILQSIHSSSVVR